jgi:hypothetical protein
MFNWSINRHEHRAIWNMRRFAIPVIVASRFIGLAEAQEHRETSSFAEAEGTIRNPAHCREIEDAIRNMPTPGGLNRIDFSAVGALSLVHFDGTLAYVGICEEPEAKVLCVTYSPNDMKVGEVVVVSGSYQKVAQNFVILDPCLMHVPDGTEGH